MLTNGCRYFLEEHLFFDVVQSDASRSLRDEGCEVGWSASVSAYAVEKSVHFLFFGSAMSFPEVIDE